MASCPSCETLVEVHTPLLYAPRHKCVSR
jgi:hypothetical protein